MELMNIDQMKSKFGNNFTSWRDFLFSLPVNVRDGVAGVELAQNRYMAGHALNVIKSNGKKAYDLFWLMNAQRLDARKDGELEGLPSSKHAKHFIDSAKFLDWCVFDEDVTARAWEWMHQGAILSMVGLHWLWTMPADKRIEAFWIMDEVGKRLSNNFRKSTEVRNEVLMRVFADDAALVLRKYLDGLEADHLVSAPQRLHCAHLVAGALEINVSKAKVLVSILSENLEHYRAVAQSKEEAEMGETLIAMRDAVKNASPEVLERIGKDIGAAIKAREA